MLAYLNKFCNYIGVFMLAVVTILLGSSCDPAFSPIEQNGRTFSIFGYLNASADTQFVRVEYLRDSLAIGSPEKLDAEIILTNTETGQTTTLQDSVFSYYQWGKAHNYYTTMDISANQSYRLEVQGNGSSSWAEVDIPSPFPTPSLVKSGDYLEVRDIGRLIAVKTIYRTCQNCSGFDTCPSEPSIYKSTFSHLEDTVHRSSNLIKANFNTADDLGAIGDSYPDGKTFTVVRSEVVVAAGTQQWPDFLHLDEEAVALPQVASNIEGGAGLLGGILTDTVTVATNSPDPCYTSSSKQ